MEQFVTIEIFGQEHTFKANSDRQPAKEVEKFLQSEIKKIESEYYNKLTKVTKVSKEAILILLALNISNEYVKLQSQYKEILQHMSEQTNALNIKMDETCKRYIQKK